MNYEIILIASLIIVFLYTGVKSGSKMKTLEDFAVSRNYFSTFRIISTIVASFVGGGVVLGTAEKVFESGICYILGLFGFSVQLILTGLFISPRVAKYNTAISVGDILRKKYGKFSQILSGILWLSFCIGIIVAQISALGKAFGMFLDFSYNINIIIGAVIVVFYCYFGGIKAVVHTDVVQFIIIIIVLPLTFMFGYLDLGSKITFDQVLPINCLSHNTNISSFEILFVFLSFLLGDALIPPVIQRMLMAKDAKQSSYCMTVAGFLTVPLILVSGGFGVIAMLANPSMESSTIIPYLFNNLLPSGFKVIAVMGIICVIMSSADSYLNTASVAFVNDIIIPGLGKKDISEKNKLGLARNVTLVIGVIAVYVSVYVRDILDILLNSYKFWGPIMVVPLAALIFGHVISKQKFYFTIISSGILVILWDVLALDKTLSVSGLVPGILFNLTIFSSCYFYERFIQDRKNS